MDQYIREEEYVNVTTSFREAINIMLVKKFETFFTFKAQDQENGAFEDDKVFDIEVQRKTMARLHEKLKTKGITDHFSSLFSQ